ncbi:putative transcriptional regulator [Selenomonas ruminantium subsp. lactilytica TAM6421]|uniref:Putative transcriptional regulator n=1 Tax=Selenomonas ruminantium subsp. lactilytica (strain NBRC 103574 / TAM6421) TaxID=927704 RepID=I0GM51_SELRL|nr:phosphoenolpyruvate hydrolase family protein [Selenomonas ruminantium]BAL81838.1 putative transcriptional regulator [Selenomonas ruminantium subsp. lactilytica TAM6421]
MLRKNRQDILAGLRENLNKGKILTGLGTGMEEILQRIDKTNVDFVALYHTGRLQQAGRNLMSSLLSYDDANSLMQAKGEDILPEVKKTPLIAGVCGTDPFRKMDMFIAQLKEQGFNGVQNFPTVGIIDGRFRANLEGTDLGYQLEVDMIREAHELDMFTCPFVFDVEQGRAMTEAGADVLVIHLGIVTKAMLNAGNVPPLADCCALAEKIMQECKRIRPEVITLCCGQRMAAAEDAAYILECVPDLDGFFSFYPLKGEDTERNLQARVKSYKVLDKMKAFMARKRGAMGDGRL